MSRTVRKGKHNASRRGRGKKANPLFGNKLLVVRFSQLPVGAIFCLNQDACGELFKKIVPLKRDEGSSVPRNAKRIGYGGRFIHIGSGVTVWTTKKELGKEKDLYEETLKRG